MIGPHLLGRRPNAPDDRDWDSQRLHEHLRALAADDARLDQTVRQVSKTLLSWKDVVAFASWLWHWIKGQPAPTPAPPPAPAPTPAHKVWQDGVVLDQGDFGTCVGNAGAGWLASEPVVDPGVTESLARQLYYEATCLDGACDSTYQAGSTSRSLAKALKARGRLAAYAFAQSMADVDEWLDGHGPVPVGTDWDQPMFSPDADGFVHPSGAAVGGHEYLVLGRESDDVYRLRNSWGTGWALGGDFRMHRADLESLVFKRGGDALLCAELPL